MKLLGTIASGLIAGVLLGCLILDCFPSSPDVLTCTITTDAPNRNGWTTITTGGDLRNFRLNPVVLWGHDGRKVPIGRVIDIRVLRKRIIVTVEFYDSPRAQEVYQMYKRGYMSAWSIGIKPTKTEYDSHGRVFVEWELLELSAVTVPANPYCVVHPPL